MIASRVTPPTEEEEAEVDGVEGVGGVDHLIRSCASLRLMVAASMAHMTWKWSETGKGTKKWRKILVIAEGKMSLSWVAVFLNTSMMERIKCKGKSIVICSKRESKNQARGLVIEL